MQTPSDADEFIFSRTEKGNMVGKHEAQYEIEADKANKDKKNRINKFEEWHNKQQVIHTRNCKEHKRRTIQ